MRDAAGELPHGLHLLRLSQRVLRVETELRFLLQLSRALNQPLHGFAHGEREHDCEEAGSEEGGADQGTQKVAGGRRVTLAVVEEAAFGVEDRADLGANIRRQGTALRSVHDGKRVIAAAVRVHFLGSFQFVQLCVEELGEAVDAGLLGGVVHRLFAERGELSGTAAMAVVKFSCSSGVPVKR